MNRIVPFFAVAATVAYAAVVPAQSRETPTEFVPVTDWLHAAPQTPHVGADDASTYVGFWIDAPPPAVRTVRPPLDVALVVDTSGSMGGAKIESARMAAASFIDALSQGDIVSLYAFSDRARELNAPTVVDDRSRAVLLERVRGLYANGGTNLWDGLTLARRAVASAPPTHPVRRIVLISDGRANVGPASAAEFGTLAANTTEDGAQITAIGVGLDYDENTLGALAVHSAGRLYHLEQPEQMASILQGELDLMARTVATNAVLEFEPAPGVGIEPTEELRVDRAPGRVRIPLGSLYGSQRREILLRTHLSSGALGPRSIGRARLVFEAPGQPGRSVATRELPIAVDRVRAPTNAADGDEHVRVMVTRYEAAQAQMRASRLIDRGDYARADTELRGAEERLRAAAAAPMHDARLQGEVQRQAQGVAEGRAATRRAVSAPSPAAVRGASLQNRSSAMDAYGY